MRNRLHRSYSHTNTTSLGNIDPIVILIPLVWETDYIDPIVILIPLVWGTDYIDLIVILIPLVWGTSIQ